MSEVVTMKEIKREQFKRNLKEKADKFVTGAKTGAKKVYNYCVENPDVVIGAAVVVVPTVIGGVDKLSRRVERMHELDIQNHRVWDPRTMDFVYTTKDMSKMRPETKALYNEMVNSGMSKYEALKTLKYVK